MKADTLSDDERNLADELAMVLGDSAAGLSLTLDAFGVHRLRRLANGAVDRLVEQLLDRAGGRVGSQPGYAAGVAERILADEAERYADDGRLEGLWWVLRRNLADATSDEGREQIRALMDIVRLMVSGASLPSASVLSPLLNYREGRVSGLCEAAGIVRQRIDPELNDEVASTMLEQAAEVLDACQRHEQRVGADGKLGSDRALARMLWAILDEVVPHRDAWTFGVLTERQGVAAFVRCHLVMHREMFSADILDRAKVEPYDHVRGRLVDIVEQLGGEE